MDSKMRNLGKMSDIRVKPFVVRRLDKSCHKMCVPTPLIPTVTHNFVYLLSGELLIKDVKENNFLIKEKQFLFIPQGEAYMISHYNNCIGYMGAFHSSYVNMDNFPNENFLQRHYFEQITLSEEEATLIKMILEKIVFEKEKETENTELCKSLLHSVLQLINSNVAISSSPIISSLANIFFDLVFDEKEDLISVSDYAARLQVTPNHLNKMIKKTTGKPTIKWIEEAIIMRSKILLQETDLSVAEIAEKMNILDHSYFSRKFKKTVGLTPFEYRKKNKR